MIEETVISFRQTDNTTETYPGLEISEEAKSLLNEWEVPSDVQQKLFQLTDSFDYGQCIPKMQKISQSPIRIERNKNEKRVAIEEFFNFGKERYGQCGDLSRRLETEIQELGILKSIEGVDFETLLVMGNSSEFFLSPKHSHIWVALRNKAEKRLLFLDPALKRILTHSEGKYPARSAIREFKFNPEIQIPVKKINSLGSLKDSSIYTSTIGISSDKNSVFGLGFAEEINRDGIIPIISIRLKDGRENFAYISPNTGELEYTSRPNGFDTKELEKIIEIANRLEINTV